MLWLRVSSVIGEIDKATVRPSFEGSISPNDEQSTALAQLARRKRETINLAWWGVDGGTSFFGGVIGGWVC